MHTDLVRVKLVLKGIHFIEFGNLTMDGYEENLIIFETLSQ
jgi:hypothetical protein